MWKESMKCSKMVLGSVYYESLRALLGFMYLYLWYNHATFVSNVCMRGSRSCGLFNASGYCSHSHCSLCSRMVIKWRPLLL